MNEDVIYIETVEDLQKAALELEQESILGFDFECENNLHHYGSYLCLIQVSSSKKNYVIDILAVQNIDALRPIFNSPSIRKIFHDVSFDLRILQHQFHCDIKNVFDTQVAAVFNGEQDIGLGHLLEKYFSVTKEKKFQMADWTKRPISPEMIQYGAKDTKYLLQLYSVLEMSLEKKKRFLWVTEECALIETQNFSYKEFSYEDLKGYISLTDKERAILKGLFLFRERLAKKVDRPAHFIIKNSHLLDIAREQPISEKFWKSLRGVHPIVRRYATQFSTIVKESKKKSIPLVREKPKRFSPKQREQLSRLGQLRDTLAKEYDLKRHLIINKDQLQQIILDKNFDALHDWQKNIILPRIKEFGIDF